MKKTVLSFSCLLGALLSNAQTPKFEWAKNIGDLNYFTGTSIVTDALGNVFTTGSLFGSADFDPGKGTSILSSSSRSDMFILKLNATGNFVWAQKISGASFDDGGIGAQSIILDSNGYIYAIGSFSGTADFDPGVKSFNMTSVDRGSDIFILKLDVNGNFVWAKQIGGTTYYDDNAYGKSISVDNSGNVYFTGGFEGKVDFDPGLGKANVTARHKGGDGIVDIFITKFDSSGKYVWVKNIGGLSDKLSNDIERDKAGNLYITGFFSGTLDFDSGPGEFNLTAKNRDIFILKLDPSGNFLWVKNMEGYAEAKAIALDSRGNIYTTGVLYGTTDFNSDSSEKFDLKQVGSRDIYVSKVDYQGNFIWAKQIGGIKQFNEGVDLDVDIYGNVYSTGYFNGGDFDPGSDTFNLYTSGNNDIFILKLDSSGNFVFATNMKGGIPNTDFGKSITTDLSGNVYATGNFEGTADFDPGVGTFNLVSEGGCDLFILKMSPGTNSIKRNQIMNNNIVYPNPANSVININMQNLNGNKINIQVLNSLGQVLIEEISFIQHSQFNIQHLPAGLYFVKVISNDNTIIGTQKIIK